MNLVIVCLPDEYNNPDPDPTSIMAWGTEIKPWHISHIRTCLDLEPLEN